MPTDNSLVQFQLDYIELLNGINTKHYGKLYE
jgi:hypothetical protein